MENPAPHFRLQADCRRPGLAELSGQLRSEAKRRPAARWHRGFASAVLVPGLSLPSSRRGEGKDHRSPEGHQPLCRAAQQRDANDPSTTPATRNLGHQAVRRVRPIELPRLGWAAGAANVPGTTGS